jgi:ribosomal protein S18 acetylase RimI-like enzyme
MLLMDGCSPAGYVICRVDAQENRRSSTGEGQIAQLGVRPKWQGRCMGSSLLLSAMRAFRAEGLRTATLTVRSDNCAARRLYERHGFRQITRLTVYAKQS